MNPTDIPVVLDTSEVIYVPAETKAEWTCSLMHPRTAPLTRFALTHCMRSDFRIRLPDGRLGYVEGWEDEALRLREFVRSAVAVTDALAKVGVR